MARPHCSRLWKFYRVGSLGSVMSGIDTRSFLKFLRRLEEEFPGDVPLHLVMDNYGTHKHPRTVAWLKPHTRFISQLCADRLQLAESDRTLVRRADFQTCAARFVLQCRRFTKRHSGFSECLERGSETLRLTATVESSFELKLSPLPPDPGADPARMYETANKKKERRDCLANSWTYTRVLGSIPTAPTNHRSDW